MTDLPLSGTPVPGGKLSLAARLGLSPAFHRIAARIPGLRHIARAEGRALFDIVQGFVQSQALFALVETGMLRALAMGGAASPRLAHLGGLPLDRAEILLRAGAGLGLIRAKGALWHLTARGAAFLTVPGLEGMVRHHGVLYRDLSDPVAFFRGETQPGLAGFWPYVFGAGAAEDPALAERYSRLMTDSQALVAAETLRLVSLRGVSTLMDVGGGTGAFLAAAGQACPELRMILLDLPAVVAGAGPALARAGLAGRVQVVPASFRDDPLPRGADAISLVRVLYDHADATVAALLRAAHDALPAGGRIIVSEPMAGGDRPDAATDVYFSVYTLAMQTGRTRSADEIAMALSAVGFKDIRIRNGFNSFVTSVVEASRS